MIDINLNKEIIFMGFFIGVNVFLYKKYCKTSYTS